MEQQSHMLAGQRPPQAQPGDNLGTPHGTTVQQPTRSSALAADALPMQTLQPSPDPPGHQHKLSGDFSMHRTPARESLQLPPLALPLNERESSATTELAPIQLPHEKPPGASGQTLPPLSSVTGTQTQRHAPLQPTPEPSRPPPALRPTHHWPSLNPFTTYYSPSYLEPVESSPSMDSARAGSVSLDDPDVRIAAEALGQMRTDFLSSPRSQNTPLSPTPSSRKTSGDYKTGTPSAQNNGAKQPQEPLLSLITTSHPLIATTIEGAASAYNTGKNYSPHLKTGAEYVESYLNPVAKAVGTVGRKTGVEGGVRWIFGIRSKKQQSSADPDSSERGRYKRRKSDRNDKAQKSPNGSPIDLGPGLEDRRMSISTVDTLDTLPAYDDQRSPAYTEVAEDQATGNPGGPGAPPQPWGQRLVVTTSGLGVAMKQESLRSLKYCLKVVRDTNGYIGEVVVRLKSVIDEYDRAVQKDGEDQAMTDGPSAHAAADRSKLIQRMTELRDDLFRAIHRTVQTVSKYAGSALPENAKNLVHRQLMSLPKLYQLHYIRESAESRRETTSPEAWTRESAHLALLFAKEALQMMTQVGDVLNRTLVSAEEWCETLYKTKNEQTDSKEPSLAPTMVVGDQDIKMTG
ncbi:hypothetical protein VTK26DRAFT_258 [Humicola hyalothermophila]